MALQKCDDCGCLIDDEKDEFWEHNKGYGATLYLCNQDGLERRIKQVSKIKFNVTAGPPQAFID